MKGDRAAITVNARVVGLIASLATFLFSLVVVYYFDPNNADFQFVEKVKWMDVMNSHYHVGVDGLSLPFVLLTTFLMPLAILSSWQSIQSRVREFMIVFLALEVLLVGMFCALDFILFYLFFEGVLVPMFIVIGIWGGERRVYAALKFFLYTFMGSILMLVAILAIYFNVGNTSIEDAISYTFSHDFEIWVWLAFFVSFAVKVPMWPVHTWLPDAHVEAPTAGSVVLAALLLKMGGYGFLRFSLPMFPQASLYFANFMYALSIIAVVYTSLVALAQKDMKKLIAYSSIAHMGIVTFGTFTFQKIGVQGAIFQMINHGLVSAALFLCVGVLYDRMHTREIAAYGGLVERMPFYAVALMIFTLASIALPGTTGFVGEILVLMSAFNINGFMALGVSSGMVLGVAYALWLYRRVIFGQLEKLELKKILDLTTIEKIVFTPLVASVVFFGIFPQPLLNLSDKTANKIIAPYQTGPVDLKEKAKGLAQENDREILS
jgi:NADH-quinone oxidoreductase subunit M